MNDIKASKDVGKLVKMRRNALGLTQRDLALASGTGIRFVIELERGKATCQLGKVLSVVQSLGLALEFRQK